MQSDARVTTITLTTRITDDGDECVNRNPGQLQFSRESVDTIRLTNGNDIDSGNSITVTIDPDAAAALFEPVPAATEILEPGASMDWTLKAMVGDIAGIKFRTDPDTCTGSDQDDVIVRR
jgi:hypothetical protein